MKVAVCGATGFTGEKLVELLNKHKRVMLAYLTSTTPEPVAYSALFPRFRGEVKVKCEQFDIALALKRADFFFLALPHTVSMDIAPMLLSAGKRVVDLSADYRIKDTGVYKKFYHKVHSDRNNLKAAVYGLPEFFKAKIKKAALIANPGCYPTSVILALAPLLKESLIKGRIVVDAKSSITGAGRKAAALYEASIAKGDLWAYKPYVHQHTPEMENILKDICGKKPLIDFMPHVVSAAGIYATIYVTFKKKTNAQSITKVYRQYYNKAPFVRIVKGLVKLEAVAKTNFCDIGLAVSSDGKKGVITSCIDNLIKGAAGSAIQNMNIMLGFKETEGLL